MQQSPSAEASSKSTLSAGHWGIDEDAHGAWPAQTKHTGLLAARIARHWARRPRRGLLALLGPGLITGASDDDPSGIATYSQAGAQFGYSMVWVMLFTWPLMAAIQEISARIGRVTGHGIAGNIRRLLPALAAAGDRRASARRQHHQSGGRSRRDGGGLAAADRRPAASLCRRLCGRLRAPRNLCALRALCLDPEMDERLIVRLCRDGAGGRRAVGSGRPQPRRADPQLGQGLPCRDRRRARHDDHALLLFLAIIGGGGGGAHRSRRPSR